MGHSSSTPFMNIQDGYNSGKNIVLFDTQDRLEDMLDKITSVRSKLPAQGDSQNRPFKPKMYQEKRKGQTRNYCNQDRYQGSIDQTVVIGECHVEVELSTDKIIEEGHSMIRITEVILEKEILEKCKITEVRILEVDIKIALGMIILEEI